MTATAMMNIGIKMPIAAEASISPKRIAQIAIGAAMSLVKVPDITSIAIIPGATALEVKNTVVAIRLGMSEPKGTCRPKAYEIKRKAGMSMPYIRSAPLP